MDREIAGIEEALVQVGREPILLLSDLKAVILVVKKVE